MPTQSTISVETKIASVWRYDFLINELQLKTDYDKFEYLYDFITNYLFHLLKTQGIGNTALTLTALTDITTTNPTNTEIVTRLNLIENAINNWSTPDCN